MKSQRLTVFLLFACMTIASCSKDATIENTTTYHFDENGTSSAFFSVSDSIQIHFSQGNLQKEVASNTWYFAEQQLDYIGSGNINGLRNDLFIWDTIDWGNNTISNGGNQIGMWRSLTISEWKYLLGNSHTRKGKYSIATAANTHGLIILPDNWGVPSGLTFISKATGWETNNYNQSEWEKMQLSGAIFLPAAGYTHEENVASAGSAGFYWPAPSINENGSSVIFFDENGVWICENELNYCEEGYSVRLVKD